MLHEYLLNGQTLRPGRGVMMKLFPQQRNKCRGDWPKGRLDEEGLRGFCSVLRRGDDGQVEERAAEKELRDGGEHRPQEEGHQEGWPWQRCVSGPWALVQRCHEILT